MTYSEIINRLRDLANSYGLDAVDKSDDETLRIEYRKNGQYVGGASYINCAAHPEYFNAGDFQSAERQILHLSTK